ncbi:hypothetical protein [Lactococcus protaetiae]|uniref:Uncharacterized protein n=1 Tax=Lactococcus protaetiae TaxID=2592653 RepID=A0A514Z6D0_9LACT|nr:hypothetical protein [Lactococcus protaetiae]QDK70155.1 hypothetical protein FLP15_01900 [Lactococcus protaetiae]
MVKKLGWKMKKNRILILKIISYISASLILLPFAVFASMFLTALTFWIIFDTKIPKDLNPLWACGCSGLFLLAIILFIVSVVIKEKIKDRI